MGERAEYLEYDSYFWKCNYNRAESYTSMFLSEHLFIQTRIANTYFFLFFHHICIYQIVWTWKIFYYNFVKINTRLLFESRNYPWYLRCSVLSERKGQNCNFPVSYLVSFNAKSCVCNKSLEMLDYAAGVTEQRCEKSPII